MKQMGAMQMKVKIRELHQKYGEYVFCLALSVLFDIKPTKNIAKRMPSPRETGAMA